MDGELGLELQLELVFSNCLTFMILERVLELELVCLKCRAFIVIFQFELAFQDHWIGGGSPCSL